MPYHSTGLCWLFDGAFVHPAVDVHQVRDQLSLHLLEVLSGINNRVTVSVHPGTFGVDLTRRLMERHRFPVVEVLRTFTTLRHAFTEDLGVTIQQNGQVWFEVVERQIVQCT
ncbi:hypothetical protein D3C80_1810880 [compost metagenome]